ncbi:MAG TPA: 2-amino-4-hydroxy-6-hydroxymethyldihydropteridine diphosphokinase, partial [Bdellovibrionota bacterium]|nr:2-amino-4-hydroxy-6-hydroxymethyldihydropteridine diphosphokinase [Bdellovibrionota bacterium]
MKIILGLGGNEGDRIGLLRAAVRVLAFSVPGLRVLAASPLYESDALLPAHAPSDGSWNLPFLNLALECETRLEPAELLAALKAAERRLGRVDRERWAPRRIDIDILAFAEGFVRTAGLEIPHPGLLERPFALLPLLDLWPRWSHPTDAARAGTLAEAWRCSPPEKVPSRT